MADQNIPTSAFTDADGSVYVQQSPGSETHFIGGCFEAGDLPNPQGDVEPIYCLDADRQCLSLAPPIIPSVLDAICVSHYQPYEFAFVDGAVVIVYPPGGGARMFTCDSFTPARVLEGRVNVSQANAVVGLSTEVHKSIRQEWDMRNEFVDLGVYIEGGNVRRKQLEILDGDRASDD